MKLRLLDAGSVALLVGAVVLAGCGDPQPLSGGSAPVGAESVPPASSTAKAPAYTPAIVAFAALVPSGGVDAAKSTSSCNLDAVNGAPPDSQPLARGGTAAFAGWAAAGGGDAVPVQVSIVLVGDRDYGVTVSTGAPRPDVAQAQGKPALADSGYVANASLATVVPGSYRVELRFAATGTRWRCVTAHRVTVQ